MEFHKLYKITKLIKIIKIVHQLKVERLRVKGQKEDKIKRKMR